MTEAAKAAFEAALEEADEDQDKVVALAVEEADALATPEVPGELPGAEGFYTSEESIFEALMPRGDGIAPVKLLKREDQGARRKDQKRRRPTTSGASCGCHAGRTSRGTSRRRL